MGKQMEQRPPEVPKSYSNESVSKSPRSVPRGSFILDKLDSPRGSLTKSSDSPRLSLGFSANSVNNISPTGNKHAPSVAKQLDFSSPRSVSSKTGFQASPRGATPRLLLDTIGAGLGDSQRFSDKSHGEPESVAEFTCGSVSIDELRQIEQILHASGSRLEELYKKVSETTFKDHAAVFESLQWDILKETGYISWFELAFTLAGYLSTYCSEEEEGPADKGNKWVALKTKSECILDQLDVLKSSLESDSDIYKLAAGTLVYCCSVVQHLEQRPEKCSCFGPRSDGHFKQQIDSTTQELKSLQDNLNFATLAAIGNRISPPIASPRVVMKRTGPERPPSTVGLEPHIKHITEYMKKNGVCLIGVYGQSGLGKTTLLNEIVSKVEATEKRLIAYIEVNEDLRRLQSSLLLQLGGGKKEFTSTAHGRSAILYQLQKLKQQNKVVRIAIDNLFDVRLVGELFPHSLGKVLSNHSSVIVTCSSLAVLGKVDQLCRTATPYNYLPYKLPHMMPEDAKTLFISHASSEPVNTFCSLNGIFSKYGELAEHFLPLCEGLPMAVKVVGSYFASPANRTDENWTAVCKRMKQVEEEMEIPEDQMFAKLMVIYEKLDLAPKEAFLDIAAFCRYWDWRTVERIVGKQQLESLVDHGLVHAKLRDTESFSGIAQLTRYSEQPWRTDMVMMHDLLYAIAGRRAQGNRVHSEDQTHLPDRLLMDSPGTELSQIQGLSLVSCKEALQGTMLEKMLNLRTLILHDVNIKGFCTKFLTQLQFFYWGKSQVARDIRIPFQMGRLRKLEMVMLRANEIDLTMKFPPQLKDLTITGCNNMDELPEMILVLTSMVELHLISCNKLQDLTMAFGGLKALRRFRLENCLSIRQLPKAVGQLTNLVEMDLSGCTNITTLPTEIGSLVGLHKLNLSRCKCLVRIPAEIGLLKDLTTLNLAQSGITSLPTEIGKLRHLETLSLSGCARLEKLPKEIGQLSSLLQLNIGSCTSLKDLPREIGKLSSLKKLSLNSCSSLIRLPEEVFHILTLQALDLDYCKLLAHLSSEIRNLRSLQRLSLNCCTRLNRLPLEIATLPSLQVLNLVGCTGLKPELPKELQKMTKEHSVKVHRDDDLVILEGPKNPSFKLYSMAY